MRIALVTHQFFPRFYTGVERITLNLAQQFARMGHEAAVVTSARHSSGSREPYAFEGIPVYPVATGATDSERPWAQGAAVEVAIRRVLDARKIDVVDVMHPLRLPSVFRAVAGNDTPLIVHAPDFYYTCARVQMLRADGTLCHASAGGKNCHSICGIRESGDRVAWCRQTLDGATAVVAPSRFLIQLHAREGFATEHWHHVAWGADFARCGAGPVAVERDELVVGYIGTLLPHKGPHVAIEAVRRLSRENIRLELFGGSFGDRRYSRYLRTLSAGDDRIRFRGAYAHRELGEILSALDVVVVPSLWHENMPTVALNAAAARVPVIGADVPGLRELIADYAAGFGFAVGSAPDLARLLEELARDRSLLESARRRIVEPPSVEEEAFRLEALYADALAAARPGRRR